jgi:hypothetical protein
MDLFPNLTPWKSHQQLLTFPVPPCLLTCPFCLPAVFLTQVLGSLFFLPLSLSLMPINPSFIFLLILQLPHFLLLSSDPCLGSEVVGTTSSLPHSLSLPLLFLPFSSLALLISSLHLPFPFLPSLIFSSHLFVSPSLLPLSPSHNLERTSSLDLSALPTAF